MDRENLMMGEGGGPAPQPLLDTSQLSEMLNHFAQLGNMRDWFEFVKKDAFNIPKQEEIHTRAQSNLLYYRTNYTLLALALFVYTVVSDPFVLVSVLIIGGVWIYLINFWRDPVCVQGLTVTNQHKYFIVGFLTLFVLYVTSVGTLVIWSVGLICLVIALHACLHDHHVHSKTGQDHV
eukprot:Rmarinus@m.28972